MTQTTMSISTLAIAFGLARETAKRRLLDAGVQPAGKERGHDVYPVAEAARAILVRPTTAKDDPESLPPFERAAWYRSESERIKVRIAEGRLVAAEDVREQMAEMAKIAIRFLETLPDKLERDCCVGPTVVDHATTMVNDVRRQIHDALMAAGEPG